MIKSLVTIFYKEFFFSPKRYDSYVSLPNDRRFTFSLNETSRSQRSVSIKQKKGGTRCEKRKEKEDGLPPHPPPNLSKTVAPRVSRVVRTGRRRPSSGFGAGAGFRKRYTARRSFVYRRTSVTGTAAALSLTQNDDCGRRRRSGRPCFARGSRRTQRVIITPVHTARPPRDRRVDGRARGDGLRAQRRGSHDPRG